MDFSARRPIDDYARRHPRLVALAVMVSSVALLATSDVEDPHDEYFYEFEVAGPFVRVELTGTEPSALVRVNVRALALGEDDIVTTEGAVMIVGGGLGFIGIDPALAPSVSVRIDATSALPEPEVLVVSSSFDAARPLEFTGDCSTFADDDPCVAVATLELARTDAGASGGTVTVNMSNDFSKIAQKSDSPTERVRLPWSVEVTTE
jgi:hypothetical protein